jgi:hypothetical protein
MLRAAVLALVATVGIAAVAHAHDLDGRWTTTFTTPNGNEITLVYNFEVEGDKLTGALTTPNGNIPVENGKVDGQTFSFSMRFGEMTFEYQGKVDGDSAELTSRGPQGERTFTMKRVPAT